MKVLIIEDEARLLKGVVRDVKSFGYEVIATASSLEEAIEVADRIEEVDIALVDIGLGDQLEGGIEVAKYLQSVFARLAIIFLTVHHKDPIQDRALREVVMANYLLKPYLPQQLELALKVAMNLKSNIPKIGPESKTLLCLYRGYEEAISCHVIKWIEVKKGLLRAFVEEDKFYEPVRFDSLEGLLDVYGNVFTRIQQSYVVNLRYVTRIIGDTRSERWCFVENKEEPLPVSRRLITDVKKRWKELK